MIVQDYKEKNGIIIFHNDVEKNHIDYNSQGLDNLFKEEERYFWFIARKEFILQQLKSIIKLSSKMIEIGAGTGNVSRYLQSKGYTNIAVGEMHSNGLKYAKSYGIDKCYQFDLLKTPFIDEFDSLCLFDVLEHIDNDNLALENVYKMLRNNGHVILTVPAHKWLWNRSDAIAGHKRRYTKKQLVSRLERNGFKIEISRYFFISIVPLLLLRKLLNKDTKCKVESCEYAIDISMNSFLNNFLLLLCRLENKINKFLPNLFGGSLLIIANKK